MKDDPTSLRTQCVSTDRLVHYLQGKLPLEESAAVGVHLSHCEYCLGKCDQVNGDADLFMQELRLLRGSDAYVVDSHCEAMLVQIEESPFREKHEENSRTNSCSSDTALSSIDPETNSDKLEREVEVPRDFGRYTIESRLGGGGMAAVYLAFDERLMRHVALKLPHRPIQADSVMRARFQQEAHAAASITHPNVCGVLDIGEQFGLCYLTMPLLEGETLAERIHSVSALPLERALLVVCDLCDAIDAVHASGIIHRDIKPANIFLTTSGKTILMDFGVASATQRNEGLTHHGSLMGTPAYFSPEQAAGTWSEVNALSDIYAIGALLYEILCGHPLYNGSAGEIIGKILHEEPPPIVSRYAEANRALISIATRAMSKRPKDRYPNATSISVAIRHWLDTRSNQECAKRNRGISIKRIVLLALSGLLMVAIGSGLFRFIWKETLTSRTPESNIAQPTVATSSNAMEDEPTEELQNLPNGLRLAGIISPAKLRTAIGPAVRLGDPLVYSLSSDAGRLAVLHNGPFVALWDLNTLTKISDAPLPKNDTTLLLTPDGKYYLTAGGGWTVRFWDVASHKELAAMPGHRNWINTLAASEDGNWIASSSKDATVRLWDLSLKVQRWSQLQGVWMRSVALFSKRDLIAAGGNDGVVRILRRDDGAIESKAKLSESGILEIKISPTDDFISTIDTEGTIRVTSTKEMSQVWAGSGCAGGSVRFMSAKNGFASTNPEGGIVIRSLPTGEPIWTMKLPKIGRVWHAVGFSSTSERLIIRSNEGHVAVLEGKWGNAAKP